MKHPTDGELTYSTSLNMLRLVFDLQKAPNGRITIRELARRLEVHERTVTRYIKALEDTMTDDEGEPLITKERIGNRSYATIKRDLVTRSTLFYYAAVHVAMQNITAVREGLLGEFGTEVKDDLRKHALRNRPELRSDFERIDDIFAYVPFGPKNYCDREMQLDHMIRGALEGRECVIEYAAAGRERERFRVRPLCIILYRDGLYVRVQAMRHGDWKMRTLALDRIENSELLSDRFRRPRDFDAKALSEGRLGIWVSENDPIETVVLRFTADAKLRAAEREWPGQVGGWKELPDGRHELRLKLAVTPEFETWLLTWGSKVEVKQPENLRDSLRATYADALEHYI